MVDIALARHRKRQRPWTPTDDQEQAIVKIKEWYEAARRGLARNWFTLGGIAGAGKTEVTAHIPEQLDLGSQHVARTAYTGKAVSVLNARMKSKTGKTNHKLIYTPYGNVHCDSCPVHEGGRCHLQNRAGNCECGRVFYDLREELDHHPVLITSDEASMISYKLFKDMTSFGVPILFVGDHWQLEPPSDDGRQFYILKRPDYSIEEPVRQKRDMPIYKWAMEARFGRPVPMGDLGKGVMKVDWDDIKREFGYEQFLPPGGYEWSDILNICYSNNTRVKFNRHVNRFMDLDPGRPQVGARVTCLRNNPERGVYNGMSGTVIFCGKAGRDRSGFTRYELAVEMDGEDTQYHGLVAAAQFNKCVWNRHSKRWDWQLHGVPKYTDLFDFGYFSNVHRVQGAEARFVNFYDELDNNQFIVDDTKQRARYVSISRSMHDLAIIVAGARI